MKPKVYLARRDGDRVELDPMGEVRVPASAWYGAHTARAVENFSVSGLRFPRDFIRALGMIKKHAALVNGELGLLPEAWADAIARAAQEVIDGKLDDQFVADIFQTGSGTSTNMNANEVIARRAAALLDPRPEGGVRRIHPNDHVNLGQSSNDVMPTALHMAALEGSRLRLLPELEHLRDALIEKARAFDAVIKVGRTHLQDAMPVRMGRVFGGYASQIEHGIARLEGTFAHLAELPLGGTAVGTGINTHPDFPSRVIARLGLATGFALRRADNAFEAQAARDACVELSGALRTVAVSLMKIANDIRFMASGPRCGLGELHLPEVQPGSSMMPGKVNPVMCEMLQQVGVQVMGNDTAVAWGGAGGNFELNTMLPVMAHNLLQSIRLLSRACPAFRMRCVTGIEVELEKCRGNVEKNLASVTALAPEIGYDRAAALAKRALEDGQTVREAAQGEPGLDQATIQRRLDPETLAGLP